MAQHLVQIAKDLAELARSPHRGGLIGTYQILADEMDKLDVNGFPADVRAKFLRLRQAAHVWANKSSFQHGVEESRLADEIAEVLSKYGGKGSGIAVRGSFAGIASGDLRKIIERDYEELTSKLMPNGAWKSAVVLAGSILEAVLYDRLFSDPAAKAKALASPKAPKKGGTVIDPATGDWKLYALIDVAADTSVLDKTREQIIDKVLREYRNFVHPRVEIRAANECAEAEVHLAKGALDSVLNYLKI